MLLWLWINAEVGRTDKNWDSFVSQVDFLEKQIKSKMN